MSFEREQRNLSDQLQTLRAEIIQLRQDVSALQQKTIKRVFFFQPDVVIAQALAAAALFSALIVIGYEGQQQTFYLYYFAPMAIPFTCFLLERANTFSTSSLWPYLVDLPVLVLSLLRAFYPLPFISGHALFLTYAPLTARTWPLRLTAALVLIEVAIFKIFVWHDPTLAGGMVSALLAALLVSLLQRKIK